MKFLVVDDELDICEILQYNLETEGYEVVTANSAEEALELPLREFGLILLDVMMGEMSGFQMARQAEPKWTALYLVKNFLAVVRQYVWPRLLHSVNVNGQHLNSERGNEIVAFIFIYTMLIVVGGVVLVAQGFPIVDAFFSSFSCVSNNGLGAGITGITGSFDFLPSLGKWVMSLLMLAGRLEIITLIALLVPDFWRK